VNYRVTCVCGETLEGPRQRARQVVTCSNCGRSWFVLPISPWSGKENAERRPAQGWTIPLLAGLVCLLAVAAGFAFLLPRLSRSTPTSGRTEYLQEREEIERVMEAGRQAMADRKYQVARRLLDTAIAERDRTPAALPPAGHRCLNQLHRQADLLARLSLIPLDEICRRAIRVHDTDERDAEFDFHHRGKTVLFDDILTADGRGRPILRTYAVRVGDETVRLALEDLKLFQGRLLDPPQRMVFGARLSGCRQEHGGGWVILFEPSSGVLLTDADALRAALPEAVARDADVYADVLTRQQAWVDQLASVKPAAP
jgi:hypothetical protein